MPPMEIPMTASSESRCSTSETSRFSALTKSPVAVLDSYFATGKDYYRDPNGCLPVTAIQTPIDAMVAEGLISEKVDAAKYLDLSLLPRPCAT